MMDFMLAPLHIIIMGPKATLGRLFNTVRYGSNTLARNLFHQSIMAIIIPRMVASRKLIIVS